MELLGHLGEVLGDEGVGEHAKLLGGLVLTEVGEILPKLVELVDVGEIEAQQEHHSIDNGIPLPDLLPQLFEEVCEGELGRDGWNFIL